MIDIVTPPLYRYYRDALQDMHRLRYRVFKERMDWDVQGENGEEWDRFDDLEPTYILATDQSDRMVGSWRLLPTTGPNMLRDEFSQVLEGQPAPNHPDVWECSRFAVDCPTENGSNLAAVGEVTSEIFCGLVEYCLSRGIHEVVTVYDVRIARILPRVGCRPKWKTGIHRIGSTKALAGLFEISPKVLADIQQAGGITSPVIRNIALLQASKAA